MPISFGVKSAPKKGAGRRKGKAGVAANFLQVSPKCAPSSSAGYKCQTSHVFCLQAVQEQGAVEAEELTAQVAAASLLRGEGAGLAEAGDIAGALRKLDAAAALNSVDAPLHELRAQCYLALDQLWPAIQAAERSVGKHPATMAARSASYAGCR